MLIAAIKEIDSVVYIHIIHICIYTYDTYIHTCMGFPGGSVVKNPPPNARDAGSVPGSGRSPGGGYGN